MIRIDASIEGGSLGGIPVDARADKATRIDFLVMSLGTTCAPIAGRIEVDDEHDEFRIIVDDECIYSVIFG